MSDLSAVSTAVLVMVSTGGVLLAVAAALTVMRMSRGPSSLDRVVAADVLVAVVIAGLALEAILHDHSTTLPVILVLSLVGFAGSVSIARFVGDRDRATSQEVPEPAPQSPDRPSPERPSSESQSPESQSPEAAP